MGKVKKKNIYDLIVFFCKIDLGLVFLEFLSWNLYNKKNF